MVPVPFYHFPKPPLIAKSEMIGVFNKTLHNEL